MRADTWGSAVVAAACCASVASVERGAAATLRVPSQYGTINAALDASAFGDTVLVAPGEYSDYETRVLQGGFPFSASSVAFLRAGVTLLSESGPAVTRIDMHGQGAGVSIPLISWELVGGDVVVDGFTITGAPAGNGGMWASESHRTIVKRCLFVDLDGGVFGGGIYSDIGDLELYDCEFRNCSANKGGAVVQFEKSLVIERCLFENCSGGESAGALYASGHINHNPTATVIVRDSRFENNAATYGPGAVDVSEYFHVLIEDCSFVDNEATTGFPGAFILGGPTDAPMQPWEVRRNLFWSNHCGEGVGALAWLGPEGIIENNTFHENSHGVPLAGACMYLEPNDGETLTVRNNIVTGSSGGPAMSHGFGIGALLSECNDFWGNVDGDFDEFYVPGPSDLFVDPQYCGAESGDFTLNESSPCLPPNSDACGLIGRFDMGCGGVAVEAESWGGIKARYRGGE